MRHNIYRICATLACLLGAAAVQADTLRCGSRLIETGDKVSHVLQECGEPQSKMKITEPVYARRPNGTTYRVGQTESEVWRYDRGYGKFPALLTFSEGVLKSIEFEK